MQKFNLLFLFLIPFLFCRFLCFRDKFVFFCITFLCFFVSVFFHDDQSYFLLAVVSVYFAVSVPAKGGVLGRTEPPFAPICTHLQGVLMELSIFQAAILAAYYWFAATRIVYSLIHILRGPLMTSLFCGIVLGDVPTAIMIGAMIQPMFLAFTA